MEIQRLRLCVEGDVQGVGFRYSCRREALRLGLTGWVRNQRDSSVELVAEGPASALRSLADWCRRGPAHARVDAVHTEVLPASGEFVSFDIAW